PLEEVERVVDLGRVFHVEAEPAAHLSEPFGDAVGQLQREVETDAEAQLARLDAEVRLDARLTNDVDRGEDPLSRDTRGGLRADELPEQVEDHAPALALDGLQLGHRFGYIAAGDETPDPKAPAVTGEEVLDPRRIGGRQYDA